MSGQAPISSRDDFPEWRCRRCGEVNSAYYRKCVACGMFRYTFHLAAVVVVAVAVLVLVSRL